MSIDWCRRVIKLLFMVINNQGRGLMEAAMLDGEQIDMICEENRMTFRINLKQQFEIKLDSVMVLENIMKPEECMLVLCRFEGISRTHFIL